MEVSVIIPIYNTEKYLRRCIDSVLNQDFEDYEILLIDDGSTDNCASICEEYAQKYSNIIVVHTPHSGVATARNLGVEQANGSISCFATVTIMLNRIGSQLYLSKLIKTPQAQSFVLFPR